MAAVTAAASLAQSSLPQLLLRAKLAELTSRYDEMALHFYFLIISYTI